MACPPLVLLALWAVAGAAPLPDLCEQEVNKIKDLLQVSCVGKGLKSVPVGLPPGTGILLLSSNRLGQVSLVAFQGLANLTDLDLANNSLAAVESASAPLPALQQLSLAHNALGRLPALSGLPRLQRLALGHNALAQLPEGGFRALRRLQDLELQGNRLRRLLPGTFEGLDDLRDLDLSDNLLEELPQALLAGLGGLQILRLERNHLRSLPVDFFHDLLFAYIYLSGNPWRCDCRLQYLRDWISDNDLSVYTRVQGRGKETTEHDPEGVTCQAPLEQEGRPVMHFQAACREPGDGEGVYEDHASPTPALLPTAGYSTGAPSLPPSSSTPGAPAPWPTTAATPSPTASSSADGLPTHRPAAATTPGPSTAPPPTTPGPSTAPPPTTPGPSTHPPAAMATPGPSTGVARFPVKTSSTPALPCPAAPMHPWDPPMAPSHCLCPGMPVRALQAAQQQAPAPGRGQLSMRCCPLRLALYVACLALVALAMVCCLGWGGLCWPLPAARSEQLQKAASTGALLGHTSGSRALVRPCLYHVCKEFQVAQSSYVTWLLISLPGPAGQWPCGRGLPGDGRGNAGGTSAASAL